MSRESSPHGRGGATASCAESVGSGYVVVPWMAVVRMAPRVSGARDEALIWPSDGGWVEPMAQGLVSSSQVFRPGSARA